MDSDAAIHSVAICTARGAAQLRRVLPAVVQSLDATIPTEILLVLNGRRSEFEAVADYGEAFSSAGLVRLATYEEHRIGLSHARNTALANATGAILTFLDDDAVPVTDHWQKRILAIFDANPRIAAVGGAANLVLPPSSNRRLLTDRTEALVSCGGHSHPSGPCHFSLIYGVNVSYRCHVARQYHFNPDLGAGASTGLSGEETFFNCRLAHEGHVLWFDPQIIVDHHVDPTRWNPRWLMKRAYGFGRTATVLQLSGCHGGQRCPAPAVILTRSLLKLLLRSAQSSVNLVVGRVGESLACACDVASAAGQIAPLLSFGNHRIFLADEARDFGLR